MSEPAVHRVDDPAQAWRLAAGRLAQSLDASSDPGLRLALLKRLTRHFGELGYPGFIKLLLIVAESDDRRAQQQLADTIALGLSRADLPSGELTSWGGSHAWPAAANLQTAMPAHTLSALAGARAPRRLLGPVEYLTVWFCQRTQRPYLSEPRYRETLARLVALIDLSPQARELYPLRIEADLQHGREGSYTRQTRERLAALAAAWKKGLPAAEVAVAATVCDSAQRVLRDL